MAFRLEQFTRSMITIYKDDTKHGYLERASDGSGREGWRFVEWKIGSRPGRAVRPLVVAVKKACDVSLAEARTLVEKLQGR